MVDLSHAPGVATGANPNTVSSEGEPHGQNPAPEAPKPTFSVPIKEIAARVKPELKNKPVVLDEKQVQFLADTVLDQYESIKHATPPLSAGFRFEFHKEFKQYLLNSGVDLNNADKEQLQLQIDQKAKEFFTQGSAEIRSTRMLMALKLAEWDGAGLQAFSGRRFVDRKDFQLNWLKRLWPFGLKDKKITLHQIGKDGLESQSLEAHFWEKSREYKGFGILKLTEGIVLVGGEKAEIATNALLTDEQKAYLLQQGWTDVELTDARREAIDEKLVTIASLRTSLYLQTGFPAKDIKLNFIDQAANTSVAASRSYITTKIAHFVMEGATGTDVMQILEAEGVQIAGEVRNKTEEELKKALEKARKENIAAGTSRQIQAEATRIKEEADLDKDDVDQKKKEIEVEIKKLEEERELIRKRKTIDSEITEATKARDEAKVALDTRAAQIGTTINHLLEWSGDINENESVIKTQQRIDELLYEQEKIQTERKELLDQIEAHSKHEIRGQTVTTKDTAGNVTQQPTPAAEKAWGIWSDEYEQLRKQIRTLDYNFRHTNWSGEGKPLPEAILDLKKLVLQRKNIIEDSATKEVLDNYRKAEKALKEKENEKTTIETKVTTLLVSAPAVSAVAGGVGAHQPSEDERLTQIKKEIKAKQKEAETTNVGLPAEKKLLISALTALAPVYSSESSARIENNLIEKERGIFLYEPGPDWSAYPPAIKAFIQLVWGADVLSTHPQENNKELVGQIKSLVSSKEYLDVIVTTIEASAGAVITIATDKTQGTPIEGAYTKISDLFSGSTLEMLSLQASLDIMNRDAVQKILENMRKKALRLP